MSWTYTFFAPHRLPLAPADLSDETVRSFTELAEVRDALGEHLPGLAWGAAPHGALARGTVTDGDVPYELTVLPYEREEGAAPTLIVSLRCSGRVDSAPFVQRLIDATGWIAFDDRAYLFQPRRVPVPGGAG